MLCGCVAFKKKKTEEVREDSGTGEKVKAQMGGKEGKGKEGGINRRTELSGSIAVDTSGTGM